MSATDRAERHLHLDTIGNVVPEGYAYRQKLVTPGEDLRLPNAYLKWYAFAKWYGIRFPATDISQELIGETRAFLTAEVEASRLQLAGDLGFVLLHLCGQALLLMVNTWRNTNELWESSYAKDLAQGSGYVEAQFESSHRATFCVWEMAPVWHERQAWVRFLSSTRNEEAKRAYVQDRFSGLV